MSLIALSGCQTTDSHQPTSMMKSAQSAPNPSAAASARTAIAAEYIRTNNLDAAQQNLAQALKDDPDSPDANNMMGVLLQQAGGESNMVKAESYFRRAISLKDDYAQVHNNYGVYLSLRQRYSEAYKQFEIAGTALGYSERSAALENLGQTALKLGKKPEAQDAFIHALQANPNVLVARVELAALLLDQNRVQAARTLYDEYLQKLGAANQTARSLWIGMRIAQQTQDQGRLQSLTQRLQLEFPDSPEYRHYQELMRTGAAWD